MRIIAGRLKGRRLRVPKNGARPSTDRLRESLFAVLEGGYEGGRVIDLFAGSGSLGLEALSRGAAEVHFVEHSRRSAAVLERNLEEAAAGLPARVFKEKVRYYLRNHWPPGGADLVLMDPPYGDAEGPRCLALLAELHAGELGRVAYEAAAGDEPPAPAGLEKLRALSCGGSQVTIFRGGKAR